MASLKLSQLIATEETTAEDLLLINKTEDGGITYTTQSIRVADLLGDVDLSGVETRLTSLENGYATVLSTSLLKDEDDMISDSAAHIPSQQSVKAYVDNSIAGYSAQANIDFIRKQGTVAFEADQSMGSNKLTNLADPTADADAANKLYVDTKISDLVGSAPEVLDTLQELSQALGGDENFATTVTTNLAAKIDTGANVNGLVASTTTDDEPAMWFFLVVDANDGSIKVLDKTFLELDAGEEILA